MTARRKGKGHRIAVPANALSLPFGKTRIEFALPEDTPARVVTSRHVEPEADLVAGVRAAVAEPMGSPPLHRLAATDTRVCIVFTDITRSCPDDVMVPALLQELRTAGVPDPNITLLCGVGMHRPSTAEEKVAKLGPEVAGRFRVLDHTPQDPACLVDLGQTEAGIPIQVHRAVAEADLVLATGIVEPHQYAGYSGGWKTLAVGAAGESLIALTHGPAFLDHAGTRLGRTTGNPFQKAIAEAGQRAGLRFIVNAVLDDRGRLLRAAAGDPAAVFESLVAFARSVYEVPIPQQYDIVIGGIGYPKDSNLYQATRAASYLFFAPSPVVRPGGFIILAAPCEEGAGSGAGEQRFLRAMRQAPDLRSLLAEARQHGYPPGQQRAFVMAKLLEQAKVVIVASAYPDLVRECKMIPAETIEAAVAMAQAELGVKGEVLVVPHAMQTLPVLQAEVA